MLDAALSSGAVTLIVGFTSNIAILIADVILVRLQTRKFASHAYPSILIDMEMLHTLGPEQDAARDTFSILSCGSRSVLRRCIPSPLLLTDLILNSARRFHTVIVINLSILV